MKKIYLVEGDFESIVAAFETEEECERFVGGADNLISFEIEVGVPEGLRAQKYFLCQIALTDLDERNVEMGQYDGKRQVKRGEILYEASHYDISFGTENIAYESHWKGNGWGKSYISPEHAKELAISFAAHWKEERG